MGKKLNIAIVTFYYNESTPRAFRAKTFESILLKSGHNVNIITPNKGNDNNTFKRADEKNNKKLRVIMKVISKFFPGRGDLKFLPFFIGNMKNKKFDLVISIGLPFSCHLAVAIAKRFFGLESNRVIFDYGDPFYKNPIGTICFYSKLIEKWVLSTSDAVFFPTNDFKNFYSQVYSNQENFYTVPQCVDLSEFKIFPYKGNSVVTFAYAGVFYKNLREPNNFINYLSTLDIKFKFIVYTNIQSRENLDIVNNYKKILKDKIDIRNSISRDRCIKELSQCDFLINFENDTLIQSPSKIIDYSLSQRPFVSIDNNFENKIVFNEFIELKFDNFKSVDLHSYDANHILGKAIRVLF